MKKIRGWKKDFSIFNILINEIISYGSTDLGKVLILTDILIFPYPGLDEMCKIFIFYPFRLQDSPFPACQTISGPIWDYGAIREE
jgi:hypothetical protein